MQCPINLMDKLVRYGKFCTQFLQPLIDNVTRHRFWRPPVTMEVKSDFGNELRDLNFIRNHASLASKCP